MDDLRSLRAWRAEVPEPGEEWIIPERRRLLTRIRGRRRALGRRLLVVGALGAAAALAVATLRPEPPTPGPTSTPSVVRLDSSVVLARAAEVVGRRGSAQVPLPTQWQYTKTLDKQPNSDTIRTSEQWVRYDGMQAANFGEDGELHVGPEGDPRDPGDDDLTPQQYDAKLRDLPTDPRKLLAKVTGDRHWIEGAREEGVPKSVVPANVRAYNVIMLYLSRYGTMPPKLEAAMYRALALIPGVRIEQGVSDAAGRRGLGVWLELAGDAWAVRKYEILDPATYRYLGSRIVWLRDESPPGMSGPVTRKGAVWSTALLSSVIVDRPGQRG
ncbi:CU044_5270 family protein [Nonomuraea sp. NEAU-A123]|uniref:CU044_5270 family protein n=1 Tax=Nonomuraea sp. NEAU-A123 TaxID=2839649 RepID=UPI001BE4ABBA|nr:CU044_5270 family protein [Nonomuraea sp. NEAU-A123]MBT2233273.1 CU044_5270 family protein [Nonomuraea sp. NEAU-A123]